MSFRSVGSVPINYDSTGALGIAGNSTYSSLLTDESTVTYNGFDSISLRRLPTDYRAHALVLAALCSLQKRPHTMLMVIKLFLGTREEFSMFCIFVMSGDV